MVCELSLHLVRRKQGHWHSQFVSPCDMTGPVLGSAATGTVPLGLVSTVEHDAGTDSMTFLLPPTIVVKTTVLVEDVANCAGDLLVCNIEIDFNRLEVEAVTAALVVGWLVV